jgi:hypothetical protein
MKTIYAILASMGIAMNTFAQPDQWYVAINPDEIQTLQGPTRMKWEAVKADTPIVIDAYLDHQWTRVEPQRYTKFIKYSTVLESGIYSKKSMLQDGSKTNRMPDNDQDFSGYWRILYDADNIYCFYDITDNEVNDNFINPGMQEVIEMQEAPYPDSASQLLNGKSYPPYTGAAPDICKKYCYWGYLGAFQIVFNLEKGGTCKAKFATKTDAVKTDYSMRADACNCKWRLKDDCSGYYAEVAIPLAITFADSANNIFPLPAQGKTLDIALDMKIIDYDYGMPGRVQASWSTEDNNVWDAMVYAGKLKLKGWTLGIESHTEEYTFSPNPASDHIHLNTTVKSIDIISIEGLTVKSAFNVNDLDVSSLFPGLYIIKINGKAAGKMIKQ